MPHPAPTSEDYDRPTVTAVYSFIVASMILVMEEQWIVLGILWTIIALSLPTYIAVLWMRDNAETHTEEWQDARFRAWLLNELTPPCEIIGRHDMEYGKCIWCEDGTGKIPVVNG